MSDVGGRLPPGFAGEGILDSGSTSDVGLARDERREPHVRVAIKMVPRAKARCEQQFKKYLKREVLDLKRLMGHKHIVAFRELLLTDDSVCIVMEWMAGGSLYGYVKRTGCLPEQRARWFLQQLIVALDYSHRMGVFNRDLKLQHLLMESAAATDEFLVIKLIDFGDCKNASESTPDSYVGTGNYISPEVLFTTFGGPKYDGRKADVWLVGCCLYRMLFGADVKIPLDPEWNCASDPSEWPQNAVKTPPSRLGNGELLPPVSAECMDFLNRTLQVCPSRRITMDDIWEHPWFQTNLPAGNREYNDALIAEGPQDLPDGIQTDEELKGILDMA